jgi:arylsulfatase A-like enzyme
MSSLSRTVFMLALAGVLACRPAEPTGPQPNVLFISIDTLRADHMGMYGYARPTTPRLDDFAKTAVVFDAVQSSSSWTLPSLASLMTSLYPPTHGQGGWKIETRLDPSFHTLAEVLRNAGYDTAIVASQIFLSGRYGLQQGFTHVDSRILQTEANITSPEITEKGVEWLREKAAVRDGVPWFLWLHYFDPHDQYLPHPGYSEKFGLREHIDLYDGEIAFTDHYIGLLLDELARLKLDQDTVVVVVADHGEEFGEHGNFGHGYDLFQEVVHVPLMLRVPGMMPCRVRAVVPSVDVMPTVLDLCWVESRFAIEGQSLLPLARGELQPEREAMSTVRLHEGHQMKGLRVGPWKYIEQHSGEGPAAMLFDLTQDPDECADVSSLFPALTEKMSAALARRQQRAIDLKREYGTSEPSQLSPAERSRLKTLGYVGNDE